MTLCLSSNALAKFPIIPVNSSCGFGAVDLSTWEDKKRKQNHIIYEEKLHNSY